jgi:hypothetical protein
LSEGEPPLARRLDQEGSVIGSAPAEQQEICQSGEVSEKSASNLIHMDKIEI